MIKNKKLLIDADCPMCRLYGKGFEKMQLIDSDTVTPYQNAAKEYCWSVNLDRAKSEIAFIDTHTNETVYGVDAFIEIIADKSEWLSRFLNFAPIHFMLKKLYRFISFNRKVIAYSSTPTEGLSCEPSVHKGYRWAYVITTAIFTGFILSIFGAKLSAALGIGYSPFLEYVICFGQIAWQGLAVRTTYNGKTLEYLGNMSSVSFLGALLIIPVILISNLFSFGGPYLIISFGIVVLIMLQSHLFRCERLGISKWVTASWIGYRLLVLATIILITIR